MGGTPKLSKSNLDIATPIEEMTMLELTLNLTSSVTRVQGDSSILREVDLVESTKIPKSTLVIVTETDNLKENSNSTSTSGLFPLLADLDVVISEIKVRDWDGEKYYSDYIKEGLQYKGMHDESVVMLFESPSSNPSGGNAFHNNSKFSDPPNQIVNNRSKFCLNDQRNSNFMIGRHPNPPR
jgi:hypothetical protein